MTRPVRGFLTKDGKFFATKLEAQTFEATDAFHTTLKQHLEDAALSGNVLDFVMDKVREFVLTNKAVVRDYMSFINTIPEVSNNDIRSVLLQPSPTGPVVEYFDPTIITNLEGDSDDEDFVSAFDYSVGSDDGPAEIAGDTTLDRLDGTGPPGDAE